MWYDRPIRNLLFDLGNVLIHCDLDFATQELSRRSSATPERIEQLLIEDELLAEFDAGRHSADEFVEEMRERIGWTGSREELERIWQQMLSPDEEMFEYLDSLVERGYRAYILSNINPYHVSYVRSVFPRVLATHGQIFSCECSMIKPDVEIFEYTRDTLGITPHETVFIDDRLPNVRAAEQVGFVGVIHRTVEDTKRKLEQLLGH